MTQFFTKLISAQLSEKNWTSDIYNIFIKYVTYILVCFNVKQTLSFSFVKCSCYPHKTWAVFAQVSLLTRFTGFLSIDK